MDENLKNTEASDGSAANDKNQTFPQPDAGDALESQETPESEVMEPEASTAPEVVPASQPTQTFETSSIPNPAEHSTPASVSQAVQPESPVPSPKKGVSKKARIIIAIVLAVALIAAGMAAYLVTRSLHKAATDGASDTTSSQVSADEAEVETETPLTTGSTTTYPKASYHITAWNYKAATIDARIKLPTEVSKYKYYTVATLDDGATLSKLLTDSTNTAAPNETIYFVITGTKVVLATNLSVTYLVTNAYGAEVVEVTIPELNPKDAVTYGGQTFSSASLNGTEAGIAGYGSNYTATLLTTTKVGKFYQIIGTITDAKDYTLRAYDLETPDMTTHRYKLDSAKISNDDATLKVTWVTSGDSKATFTSPLRGCGQAHSYSDTVLNFTPDVASAVKVGTVTATGKPVYRLTTASFVKTLYDEYAYGRESDKLSLDDFKTKLTHVVFQDGFGKWVLLQNTNYGPNAECGKPVIYLYPTKTTAINVSVDANVTVSDPLYPAGGWKKVVAQPNGKLSYKGRSYDSLFWEGKGYGMYPDASTVGSVVSQNKLLETVRQQLAAQGLNAKETSDFMDFWSTRLPKTPYVKLTWLTTKQMNDLAPLTVSPTPQTVVRVFLDAQGLQKPTTLVPQSFSAPSRQGFTLVEWGGLITSAQR